MLIMIANRNYFLTRRPPRSAPRLTSMEASGGTVALPSLPYHILTPVTQYAARTTRTS